MKRPYRETLHEHLPNFISAAVSADWSSEHVGDYSAVKHNLLLAQTNINELLDWIDKHQKQKKGEG
jgi:hypothetical protein